MESRRVTHLGWSCLLLIPAAFLWGYIFYRRDPEALTFISAASAVVLMYYGVPHFVAWWKLHVRDKKFYSQWGFDPSAPYHLASVAVLKSYMREAIEERETTLQDDWKSIQKMFEQKAMRKLALGHLDQFLAQARALERGISVAVKCGWYDYPNQPPSRPGTQAAGCQGAETIQPDPA